MKTTAPWETNSREWALFVMGAECEDWQGAPADPEAGFGWDQALATPRAARGGIPCNKNRSSSI
jgi:hypothetical protein